MRVHEVGGSIALKCQHLIPTKHIIADPIIGQVRVLDGPDCDHFGNPFSICLAELRRALIDDAPGTADRLLDQRQQADRLTRPGLEHLAILAQHGPESDMLQPHILRCPAGAAARIKDHREMLALRCANDVQEALRRELLYAVLQCCKIGRGIAKTAILFANDQWNGLAVAPGKAWREYAGRALAGLRQPLAFELRYNGIELAVVAAFAGDILLGQPDVKLCIQRFDVD